jgi:hypothetical protein
MNDLYIFQLPIGSKLLMDGMILLVHRIYLAILAVKEPLCLTQPNITVTVNIEQEIVVF